MKQVLRCRVTPHLPHSQSCCDALTFTETKYVIPFTWNFIAALVVDHTPASRVEMTLGSALMGSLAARVLGWL